MRQIERNRDLAVRRTDRSFVRERCDPDQHLSLPWRGPHWSLPVDLVTQALRDRIAAVCVDVPPMDTHLVDRRTGRKRRRPAMVHHHRSVRGLNPAPPLGAETSAPVDAESGFAQLLEAITGTPNPAGEPVLGLGPQVAAGGGPRERCRLRRLRRSRDRPCRCTTGRAA